MEAVNRYTLAGPWKAEPDTQGEWVLWRDVRSLVDAAGEVAERHDHYRKALLKIAAIPLSLPNSAAGVKAARDALDMAPPKDSHGGL